MFSDPSMTQDGAYRSDVRVPLQPIRYHQYTPADPPQGMSYAAFLRTWSDDHVARWLHDIRCACHQDAFRANDIRGDLLLDLDQKTLQEIGIASIGDKLRILNAVKILRQKVSGKSFLPHKPTSSVAADRIDGQAKTINRRLENVRPAPLLLTANAGRGDLPAIQRDPDSARGSFQQPQPTVRPLPTMPMQSTPPSNGTPSSAQSSTSVSRSNLPPLPPPTRPPPPPPSGQARPNHSHATSPAPDTFRGFPSAANTWVNQHLPADPRPGNPGSRRAISPLPHTHPRPNQSTNLQRTHARNGSSGNPVPSSPTKRLPIANQAPTNHPPLPSHLSPIDEVFTSTGSNTPSPPTIYRVGSGPFNTPPLGVGPSSLDDLRKRLVKFIIPDEGLSFTIDVASCTGGVEVVEKVLRKFVKNNYRTDTSDVSQTEDGGLAVDGWGVYPDLGQGNSLGQPFTEAELLAICLAPDHPLRENGLVLRRLPRTTSSLMSRNTKRASSISILSDLGVRNPERALDAPPLPTSSLTSLAPSGRLSPASHISNARRPSKLRNFFGQRPPSELITNHLTEFFPNTEKKVLQRTARNSMMRKRESVVSYKQLSSRFSTSSQGSRISQPPPVPDKGDTEDLPRVSLSTDDGRSVDLHIDSDAVRKDSVPHLPPIPFPSAPLSESIDDVANNLQRKRMSRSTSTSSNRLSYMTELRSKRDKSDTASLMTVDQITEAVENRRASGVYGREEELEGWTKVDSEIEGMVPTAVADDDGVEDEEDEDDGSEISDDEEDETLNDDAAELGLDVDDDGMIRNVMSAKRANKWIKGALIGAGSFGKVYLGMDASSGLLMAVKQVELSSGSAPNQERKKSMLTALEREIELLQTLHHENIVQYLYSSIDEEYLNIFLEYVPGGSVSALLRNYGSFEETLVKNFVKQILQGLNYLHERDIIHRDIKGANILVDNKGGVKISDFGISKKVDTLLTGNKVNRPSLQGSVFWMAPEVVKQTGHTHKADIWSVGCLIVEMLTGEHPWAQLTQMQAIFRIGSSATPTIPSDISSDAQDFLKQAFRIDHEARPSGAELLQHPWIATKANTKV